MTEIIQPYPNELPTDFADRLGEYYSGQLQFTNKKEAGQYFTPPALARFIGSFADIATSSIRILDPGCGTAILSCALIEELMRLNSVSKIFLTLYETDKNLLKYTNKSLLYLSEWLEKKRIDFKWELIPQDFILDSYSLFSSNSNEYGYDLIIANPPFFKLSKDDTRAIAVSQIANGISNIYAAFLVVASTLLNAGGELIFIVPRSFSSGLYFKDFRNFFFRNVQICNIHLFQSRKDAFSRDKVLQETIIIKGKKRPRIETTGEIELSSSGGLADISSRKVVRYKEEYLIDFKSKDRILHLPIDDLEGEILNLFKSWDGSLEKYNLKVSTGPIVAFRVKDKISDTGIPPLSVPLLWLHNITRMKVDWPVWREDKGQFIENSLVTVKLLVPNKNYVLMRRFSAKDDKYRLVAAPHFYTMGSTEKIGIENKLNYIYRPNGHLLRKEILGLCALLNSSIFDNYFRIFNGNINVSATELRAMPLPPLEIIYEIGEKLILLNDFSTNSVDKIINNQFKLEFKL